MMESTKSKLLKASWIIQENINNKFMPYNKALYLWLKNWRRPWFSHTLSSINENKSSDTLFILGSGSSLNDLTNPQIEVIKNNNSFGMNFSFLKEEIVPTYHQFSYEKDPMSQYFLREKFKPFKESYAKTVFFWHSKSIIRLGHHRTLPELFPANPHMCYYQLPPSISLQSDRPFRNEDFDNTLFYRGTLTLVLDLAIKMDYRKIVLLGVDPLSKAHFFDTIPHMDDYIKFNNSTIPPHDVQYENMVPKPGKPHTIDTYLCAVRKYLTKQKGIDLLVGTKESFLNPNIPYYFQ